MGISVRKALTLSGRSRLRLTSKLLLGMLYCLYIYTHTHTHIYISFPSLLRLFYLIVLNCKSFGRSIVLEGEKTVLYASVVHNGDSDHIFQFV